MKKALALPFLLAACEQSTSEDIEIQCASKPIIDLTIDLCQKYRKVTLIALGGLHEVDGLTHAETSDFLDIDCSMPPDDIATKINSQLDLSTAEFCVIRPPS